MTWEEYDDLTVRVEKVTVLREDYEDLLRYKQSLLNLKEILEGAFDNTKYNESIDSSLTRLVGGDRPRRIRAINLLVKFIDEELINITKLVEEI